MTRPNEDERGTTTMNRGLSPEGRTTIQRERQQGQGLMQTAEQRTNGPRHMDLSTRRRLTMRSPSRPVGPQIEGSQGTEAIEQGSNEAPQRYGRPGDNERGIGERGTMRRSLTPEVRSLFQLQQRSLKVRPDIPRQLPLGYGVIGGMIGQDYYAEVIQTEFGPLPNNPYGPQIHRGVDVSTSRDAGGGANDPRRGLPVYFTVKPSIELDELNGYLGQGVRIPGRGLAKLQGVVVHRQPWRSRGKYEYGGVVGFDCTYNYVRPNGAPGRFTLRIEYLHLITTEFLPKDGTGAPISDEIWRETGKGIGFGDKIVNNARFTATDLTTGSRVLVGYLGATEWPHVHIQAFLGERRAVINPMVMISAQ